MLDIFVTDKEASEILKVNVRHIRRMYQAGVLRGKDIGLGTGKHKRLRLLLADVTSYKKSK